MLQGIKKLLIDFHNNDNKLINSYHEKGFIVIKKFFKKEEVEVFTEEIKYLIANRESLAGNITIDVLDGPLVGKRLRLRDVSDETLLCKYKLNDLFLESESCRNLALNTKLCHILEKLLKDKPLIINSLTFRQGSQQPYHFDTYYMPPPVQNMMAVTSICLEDQSEDTGPLSYYPKSHKIPPYTFSHGGFNSISEEMENATNYIKSKIESQGLQPETFIGDIGDVFIWHAQLYHGGLPIIDNTKTRKTLVTHYWRRKDVDQNRIVITKQGGSYLKREHQKV